MKSKEPTLFLLLFFSFVILLDMVAGIYMVNWYNPVNIGQFIILQFINFGMAYGITELIMISLLKDKDPPRLDRLGESPPVALLYTTYNDAMPGLLSRLKEQTYRNYDVFVLDDSTDEKFRRMADSSGYRVIRRRERKGFKAGAINNWLSKHGKEYKYFIVLDSDSLLNENFTENMVRYAEHPGNSRVGVFQSVIEIWNRDNGFSRTLSRMMPVWNYGAGKLANSFDTSLSWGHNCLYRTGAVGMAGGFDETSIAEDFATAIRVAEAGYRCRIVNETSYESTPKTPGSYAKRSRRWCRGITEIMMSSKSRGLPFTTRLYLVMSMYSYLIWIFYVPGMLISTIGYESSLVNVTNLMGFIAAGQFINTPLLPAFIMIFFYISYFLLFKLPIALRVGVGVRDYFKSLLLLTALGFYMLFPIIKAHLETLAGRKSVFEVTPKGRPPVKFLEILREMKYSIILIALLIAGIIRNPISLIFNFFWLIPFVASPIILYLACSR